ncbi:MAG TPA: hypothetical protein VKZ84_07285 [Bacteriovoracaceae bacterium]|nr:hypothetical protein [Bacteriovoracaceae bacterium]
MEPKLESSLFRYAEITEVLFRYERSQILEVYFSRLDGRENVNPDLAELYEFSLEDLKLFLAGRFQQDPLIQQLTRLHSQALESNSANY